VQAYCLQGFTLRNIDQYERDYLDNPFEAELVKYRHRKTVETLELLGPSTILEVGCGLVPLYDYFKAFKALVIFEPSLKFADAASEPSVKGVIVVNDELKLEYAADFDEKFDLIVISSLLHELENPLALLECARGFLAEGGAIHINVPNSHSMHRVLAKKMGLINRLEERSDRQVRFQQHHTFSVKTLEELVGSAGFEILSSETFFIKPFTHAQMQSLLDSGLITQAMLDGLYLLGEDMPGMGAEIVMNVRIAN
jgi:SAM-dependent methyltransferase